MKSRWVLVFLWLFAWQSVASFVELGAVGAHDLQHHQNESVLMLNEHLLTDDAHLTEEHQHSDEHHVHLCHHHHGEHNPPVLLSPYTWKSCSLGLFTVKFASNRDYEWFMAPLLRPPIAA